MTRCMQLRAAVFVAVASVHCWQGFDQALVPEVTYLNCCDTQTNGATGLASCWDGVEYTFEICCTDADDEDVEVPYVRYKFRGF